MAPPVFSPGLPPTPQFTHTGPDGTPAQSPYGFQQGIASPGLSPGFGPDGGLAAQMQGLGIQDHTHRKKKKDRHAYHSLEAPGGTSQAFNGVPQNAGASPTQFLNAEPSTAAAQYGMGARPVTPLPSQFQNIPGTPFNPAQEAAASQFGAPVAQVQPSHGGKVDPEQIPSVPRSRDVVARYYLDHVYPTFEHHAPPPAAVPFVAFDQGNSSPKFTRLSINNIPATADGLKSTGLPLGMVLQPLAPLQAGELEIPVLDFGDAGPPRCHRCRAYINPFMVFRQGGNKFVCNMCTYPNDVPSEYFCQTSPAGIRLDREQRPELMRGTVEFMVPKEYWSKQPVGIRWLFLIDVTQEAYNKGFLSAFCDGILSSLYSSDVLEEEGEDAEKKSQRAIPPGAKVGFVTFDKEVHFYNCSVSLSVP